MAGKAINRVGEEVGDYVVVSRCLDKAFIGKKDSYWLAVCSKCGSTRTVAASQIKRKSFKSCKECSTITIDKEDKSFMSNNNRKTEYQTAKASKYPQGFFNNKPCRNCGDEFTPNAPSHLYCSDQCSSEAFQDKLLLGKYGISSKDYLRMVDEQGHVCKICGEDGKELTKSRVMKLEIDHCHETGKVRGLLCHKCNKALGLLKDNIETLSNAIKYLKEN